MPRHPPSPRVQGQGRPPGQATGRGRTMTEASVSFAGNLTDDPEVRYSEAGIARAVFRVPVSDRREQEASFFTVVVWRDQAEHAAESLARGSRVVVVGRLQQSTSLSFRLGQALRGILVGFARLPDSADHISRTPEPVSPPDTPVPQRRQRHKCRQRRQLTDPKPSHWCLLGMPVLHRHYLSFQPRRLSRRRLPRDLRPPANEAGGHRGLASPIARAGDHRRHFCAAFVLAGRAPAVPQATVRNGRQRSTAVSHQNH
jgi:Single-strand binding protein family